MYKNGVEGRPDCEESQYGKWKHFRISRLDELI